VTRPPCWRFPASLPTLDRSRYASAAGVARGAYVADTPERKSRSFYRLGSELILAVQAHENLIAGSGRAWYPCRPEIFEPDPQVSNR
jgi:transketolase